MLPRTLLSLAVVSLFLCCADSRAQSPPAKAALPAKQSELKKVKIGSIRPVHALGDIYLTGQPRPEDLEILKREGIKTIITLRKPEEVNWDEAEAVKKQGMTFVEVPFSGAHELKPEVFDKVLKILRDKKSGPTVLHCGSANRVGGIWYAYRVLDGELTPAAALKEAKTVGLRNPGYLKQAQSYVQQVTKQDQPEQPDGKLSTKANAGTE